MKKWICIILAAMLCLALVACGEGEGGGEPINMYAAEVVDCIEQHLYDRAMARLVEMGNSQDSGAGATDLAEYYPDHKEVLTWLEAGEYEKVASRINELQIQYLKSEGQYASIDWSLVEDFYGQWQPSEEQPMEITLDPLDLNKDGSIQYEGKTCYWIIESINISDLMLDMYIVVYHADGSVRTICLSNWIASGFLQLCVQYDNYGLNYTKGNVARDIFGWWSGLTTTDVLMLNEYGSLRINNDEFTFETVSEKEDTKVLQSKDARLEITVTKRGEYWLMTVKDDSGNEKLFYRDQVGYDETWPEVLYDEGVRLLKLWLESPADSINWDGQPYTRQEVLAMAYSKLVDSKGYADAADYVKRFTVYKDLLMKVDNPMENTAEHTLYTYDEKGRLVEFYGINKEIEQLTQRHYDRTRYTMTYDSKNRVKTVTWLAYGNPNGDRLLLMEHSLTYTYDKTGNVSQILFKSWDDTCTIDYVRDLWGTLRRIEYLYEKTPCDYEEGFFCDFGYGWEGAEDGLLISEVLIMPQGIAEVEYTYDAKGNVIAEKWVSYPENYGEDPVLEAYFTYTYDSTGKLIYATKTGDNVSVDKVEYNYIYQDYYTFK